MPTTPIDDRPATAVRTAPNGLPDAPEAPPKMPLRRRHGIRMSCARCEVAWTGAAESSCWFCEGPGVPGPPPSIYPDLD